MKITTKITTASFAAIFGFAMVALAEDAKLPPASTKTGITYATDIKPIFDASCVKCHSGERPKARLRMDSLEGVLKGTKEGKIITAGDSTNSVLVKVVAHLTPEPEGWMPPPNNRAGIKPLTPEQIGLIRGWIDQGTK
ncbi:MAG: c-type cytochrome domain-containing protein [Limisphaerales bacterium]